MTVKQVQFPEIVRRVHNTLLLAQQTVRAQQSIERTRMPHRSGQQPTGYFICVLFHASSIQNPPSGIFVRSTTARHRQPFTPTNALKSNQEITHTVI
ncbi:hypothetical protein T12_1555 [Trichinella patagoniensis]|uniref:Uncharacterized protein n=1 Tax=Trichinella patagoniensis TaxID=990121 RepID=A0A0V0ZQP2_9BILA|nr:hypothetical protein T12_1555 [Trichinella patagoniensis]